MNNTIFASLAVKFGFHKYFRHLSPGLNEVVERFVRIQEENGHAISEEVLIFNRNIFVRFMSCIFAITFTEPCLSCL